MGKLRNKKTGEIVDLSIFGITLNIRKEEQPTYHSIEGVCEDWEDVEKPLIKDEKIRKAVRAWAEAVGVDKVIYEDSGWHYEYFRTEPDEYDHAVDIDFWHKLDADLCSGNTYTIVELCGEEEE